MPGLRWMAGACGVLAGLTLGRAVAIVAATAKGLPGDEYTTPYAAAVLKSQPAGRCAAIFGLVAGYFLTAVMERKSGGLAATLIGCFFAVLAALVIAFIIGWF